MAGCFGRPVMMLYEPPGVVATLITICRGMVRGSATELRCVNGQRSAGATAKVNMGPVNARAGSPDKHEKNQQSCRQMSGQDFFPGSWHQKNCTENAAAMT